MAALTSKIIEPYMPSLNHLALVKIAVPMFNKFGAKTLKKVFKDIQRGNTARYTDVNCKTNRAKETLQFIPAHLRNSVMEAVMGLHWAVFCWKTEYSIVIDANDDDFVFHWRPDGTLDATKMAQELVQNESYYILKRFDIACRFFLEESVLTLWKEMEASGETSLIEGADGNFVTSCWVRWLRDGCRVPWLQAVEENHSLYPALRGNEYPRCSAFFPLLGPKHRDTFLNSFEWADYDDFRFCLYAANEEEERKILKKSVVSVLILYLDWPLRNFFLETAEKLWPYLDEYSFYASMMFIWSYTYERTDYDYFNLFLDYWNRSPNVLKELVRESPYRSKQIDWCLNKINRKRRSLSSSDKNQKMWMKKDGRKKKRV